MWLAPAFLLGLLAIGLPLWLHRFARHIQLRRQFASLMLLEPSEIQHSRKRQLRYWLLLALRIALLALLALAFAEPVLRISSSLPVTRGSILHVVVLDTSLSMQQGDRWQRAVNAATGVIDRAASGDRVVLVAADYRVRVIHEPVPGSASEELHAALAGLKPGLSRLDYGMLMSSADAWIGTRGERTQLHLITDVQQSAAPLRFADLAPPPGVQLQVIDVGNRSASNAYIDRIEFAPQDASAISVRVTGMQAPGPAREVLLSIDGMERGSKAVPPLNGGSVPVIFAGVELGAGQHRVTATLEPGDALTADDRYYATLEHSEPRVLLVAANPSGDDAAYLAAAVGSLTGPRLAIDKAVPAALDTRALADYSAVFIADAGLLSSAAAENLKRYVTSGGAVLMTLGARAATQPKVALTDDEITRSIDDRNEQAMRIAELEQSHPVLRDSSGWRGIRFFRYVPVAARSGDKVLMRLESGMPLLIETPVGDGKVLVLTSALERAWNDLALHPLFVRFIAEAARYLTGASAQRMPGIVGSTLTTGLHARSGAQLFDPRGERVLSLNDTAGATRVLATQPGFYEVRGGGRVEWLAVNADGRESDLTPLPPEAVQRWQALQQAPSGKGSPNTAPGAVTTEPKLLPLWFWLLLGAIVLAFLEPLVANYHLHVQRERTS